MKLCRGANVLPDRIDWSDVKRWPTSNPIEDKLHLKLGDVVLAMDRPWIKSGIKVAQIKQEDLPSYLVQRVTRLRAKRGNSNSFLYFSIRHPAFTRHCGGLKTETTVPHIASDNIKTYELPVPPPKVQQNFERIAALTQASSNKQKKLRDEADDLFNSLVQRAFKGVL